MQYLEILKNLIEINTSSPTLDAVKWVKSYLSAQGISSNLIYNSKQNVASLVASIGDENKPGVVFSGHLDVVPASEGWQTPPFQLCEKNGILYGRGTTDMKGAIAVALSLVPAMKKSGKTFHFVLTSDEETVCECVQDVLKEHSFSNVRGCIVMEATECAVIIGHKTINGGIIEVSGKAAHSSQPSAGVNALTHAVYLHQKFYELASQMKEQDKMYEEPGAVAEITMCQAGTADNVIPDKCSMSYNVRCLNRNQQDDFLLLLKKNFDLYAQSVEGLSVSMSSFCNIPGFNMKQEHPFVQSVLKFSKLAYPPKVSYATEGGYYAQEGFPVVIWGPGSILYAHQVNESIPLSQLELFYNQLENFILSN